jgi:stage II sporulation protein R
MEAFPTRDYETFSLPAGQYTALRVVIGEGKGRNWWCVVYPPLCTTAALAGTGSGDNQSALKTLSSEEVKLISSDKPKYVLKFKTIEIIEKIKSVLGLD